MFIGTNISLVRGGRSGGFTPATLFASGEQGAWYDPSDLTTLYQDSVGTTPVTADGDPVGLMLDKSQGLVLNANIADHDIGPLGSTSGGRGTQTLVGDGYWECETTQIAGVGLGVFFASELDVLDFGSVYEVEVDIQSVDTPSTGTKNIQIGVTDTQIGGRDYIADKREATVGTYKFKLRVKTAGSETLLFTTQDGWDVGDKLTLKVSVRELPGNHATQSTAAARPVYRTDGTLHWLEPDKVDDHMTVGVAGDFNFLHDGTGCEWFFAQKLDDVTDPSTFSAGWITGNTASKNVGSYFAFDDRTDQGIDSAYRYIVNRGVTGQGAIEESIDNTVPDLSKTYVFNGGHASARTPNYFAFLDKAEVYSGDYSNPPSTEDSLHPLTLFARAENDFHMGGRFFGALFIGRVLTDTERANARAYLASKSGVTL